MPVASEGSGCSDNEIWFNYGDCDDWKEYPVNADAWVGLYAYGDSCGGCVLWHVNFSIQEYIPYYGWQTVETHNPEPDTKGMVYTTSFRTSSETNKIRIYANSNAKFYLKVYDLGVENGGFESGSWSPGWVVKNAQPFPSITSNSTYVAGRGSYSLGNAGGGIYSGSNRTLWGYGIDVDDFKITSSSRLYFDTYGAYYSTYAHHHVKVWWQSGVTKTYDNYVCCYNKGIKSGWSQQIFDFPTADHGKVVDKIEITFHKDHSIYSRYKPTIYLDNISIR